MASGIAWPVMSGVFAGKPLVFLNIYANNLSVF